MKSGLNFWKNKGDAVLLDADNLFWATAKTDEENGAFIPLGVMGIYRNFKDRIDSEIKDFRFGKDLTAIYIDPTDKCNARCPYCYIPHETREKGRSMTEDELNFILEKIGRYFYGAGTQGNKGKNKIKPPVIIFHASEPLIVKDIIFKAIVKYNKVFKFGLQTNAILMEKKDVEFLKKYRVGVGISLDSHLSNINDKSRRSAQSGSNYKKALKSIEWFDGYEGLNVISTITKFNVEGLPGLVRFLHKKKVPCVLLNPVRFTLVPIDAVKPDEKVLTDYFIKAVDTAMNLSKKSGRKIIIGNFSNTILAIIAPVARRLMCDISPCGGGRCFFTVTASGDMIPCGEFTSFRDFRGGNIFRDPIEKAMESAPFKKVRARFVEKIPKCKNCIFRNICGAPCPAELYSLGDINEPSIFCEFYKAIIKYAFRLIAEKKEKYFLREHSLNSLQYQYKI